MIHVFLFYPAGLHRRAEKWTLLKKQQGPKSYVPESV